MICFFKFPLIDTLGGAEFHTLRLARYFESQGQAVKLFTSDKKLFRLFQDNALPAEYVFAGWEPTSKWSLLFWPLTHLIARLKFKGILRQIPTGSTLFLQSLTEKLTLTPLLHTKRSTLHAIFLEHKIPGRWLKLNPLKSKYLKLARQVQLVTVSNFAKRKFVKLGVPEKNIRVIYPGVSPSPSRGEGNIVVGILSRLDVEKGVLDFLKTIIPHLPNHSDWKILIAGVGQEEQAIKRLAQNHKQVQMLGFISDLDQFFSQISVLVYPTKVAESFGMAALEAMSRGIPVIASGLGALPEIIENGKNGFLVNEQNQWVICLAKLQDQNLYQQISQNSISRALNFSEEKMFSSFDEILNQKNPDII